LLEKKLFEILDHLYYPQLKHTFQKHQ